MKAHNIPRIGAPTSAALQCQTNPPQRILVVEDEPDIRQLDLAVLSESGYQVETVENGLFALHKLKIGRYDLLMVEEEMSTVTGLELVKAMRSQAMMVPVILVLGAMPTEGSNRNLWPQIQALLIKPYTIGELSRTVREVLRTARNGAISQFVPPSNWQSPSVSRWCASLRI
jgi:two-component system response regulator QseB